MDSHFSLMMLLLAVDFDDIVKNLVDFHAFNGGFQKK